MYEILAILSGTGVLFFMILAVANLFRKKKKSKPHIFFSIISLIILLIAVSKIVSQN